MNQNRIFLLNSENIDTNLFLEGVLNYFKYFGNTIRTLLLGFNFKNYDHTHRIKMKSTDSYSELELKVGKHNYTNLFLEGVLNYFKYFGNTDNYNSVARL